MKYILLFTTFLFAGELEVDGDLTVLGNVNAPGLGGMKPERIYQLEIDGWSEDIVVPDGKLWIITPSSFSSYTSIRLNGIDRGNIHTNGAKSSFHAFPSQLVNVYSSGNSVISIFEYSISSTGTDQGMDYVEP